MAAQVSKDDFPEIAELDDGGVFALRLDGIVDAHPEPFETAEPEVAQAWERAEVLKLLTTAAEALKAEVDGGATISSRGHPVTVETHLTRNAFIESAPAALLSGVFELEEGESIIVAKGSSVIIAKLASILPPDENDPDSDTLKTTIDSDTAQSMAQDVLLAFTRAVETEAGITLNQEALNAVHAQFP